MPNDYGYDYTPLLWILFTGYLIVIALIVLISYIVMAIALSLFFKKVGVEPWKAWVPVYGYYTWLQVGGQNGYLAILSVIPYAAIVTWIFLYIGMYRSGFAFGKEAGFLVLGIFFPFVWLFILASRNQVYRPELIAARGYPPPLAGYGAVPV